MRPDVDVEVGLRDRALFALADREADQRDELLELTREAAQDVLGVDLSEMDIEVEVDLKERAAIFKVDGLRFRVRRLTTGGRAKPQMSCWGRAGGWNPVGDLADVGEIVRARESTV